MCRKVLTIELPFARRILNSDSLPDFQYYFDGGITLKMYQIIQDNLNVNTKAAESSNLEAPTQFLTI